MLDSKKIVEQIKFLIDHKFREVLIVSLTFACFLGIIIGLFIYFGSRTTKKNPLVDNIDIEKQIEKTFYDKKFLVKDLFVYPPLDSFDITSDYIEFMPLKTIIKPGTDIIHEEYDKLIEETIDESCKFNFEKRMGK